MTKLGRCSHMDVSAENAALGRLIRAPVIEAKIGSVRSFPAVHNKYKAGGSRPDGHVDKNNVKHSQGYLTVMGWGWVGRGHGPIS